jgi:general secretion pathway protein D
LKQLLNTRLHVLALAAMLTACAGPQTYHEGIALLDQGKLEQGIAKLEQARQQEPGNAEYRNALVSRKGAAVNQLNTSAEQLRLQGKLDEAEAVSRRALAFDPNNTVALQSVASLTMDRRHQQAVQDAQAAYQRGGENNVAFALEQLRIVLQERPNHRDALRLKSRINDEQAAAKGGSGRLAIAYRKPVTLEFRDAPVRSVFDFLGKVSGLNFAFDRDVDPNIRTTISVRETSIEDAIALLLSANGLEQSVTNDRSVMIYPNTPQKVKDYQQLVVRSFYLANSDPKTVSFSIKTLLKAKDIVTDDRLGIIMMRDTPEMIRMAEKIIAMQDVADPEVMLEVEVLEVKRSRLMELGVRWPDSATLSLATPTVLSDAAAVARQLTVNDLKHINGNTINVGVGSVGINANKTDTDSNILANPRIRVRNKEKAKVLIGDRVPVITVTTNTSGLSSSDSVNYVDVGLKLDVEPNVYLDDEVAIKINLEVSSVVKEVISKSGTQAYQIGTRSASTVLRLRDGETQVLAGLINDEDRITANKIPGVGDLPVLNRLFGSQKNDNTRSEIVLSITPHVLRGLRRPDLATAQFNSGTESAIGGGASPVAGAPVQPQGAGPAAPAAVPPRVNSPMTGGDEPAPAPSSPPPGDKGPGADAPKKGQPQ